MSTASSLNAVTPPLKLTVKGRRLLQACIGVTALALTALMIALRYCGRSSHWRLPLQRMKVAWKVTNRSSFSPVTHCGVFRLDSPRTSTKWSY